MNNSEEYKWEPRTTEERIKEHLQKFKFTNILAAVCCCFFMSSVFSQGPETGEHGDISPNEHSAHWALAGYMGTTLVPTLIGSDDHKEYLFVPTYGIEIARKLNGWLGFGFHNEFELQNYVVVNQEGEELDRSYIYVGSALVYFIPIRHLAIFMGPGYELSSHHNFRVFKFGMEYVLYRGDGSGWYLAPEISLDWISTLYSTFSFGLAAGKSF